jgi:hypothetical protein
VGVDDSSTDLSDPLEVQEAIMKRLAASGHAPRDLGSIVHDRAAFLVAAPLILDHYASLPALNRGLALACLQARFSERSLALRLRDLLVAEGEGVRSVSAEWSGDDALVGLAGRDHDLLLEFACNRRLCGARIPIILAQAKRRDLRVVPLIQQTLGQPAMRSTALEAIGLMRLHAFAPQVHDSLHGQDPDARRAARMALKRLQDGKT